MGDAIHVFFFSTKAAALDLRSDLTRARSGEQSPPGFEP